LTIAFDQAAWTANFKALLGSAADNPARWNAGSALGSAVTISYRFADSIPSYQTDALTHSSDFRSFPEHLRAIARDAMNSVENLTNITFVEDTTSDAWNVALVITGTKFAGGSAYFPGAHALSGDISIGIGDGIGMSESGDDVVGDGSFAGFRETFLHELGHALGLAHPRSYSVENNELVGSSAGYSVAIDPAMDNDLQSILSYFGGPEKGNFQWNRTMMPLDIMGLQHLYGTDETSTAGNNIYTIAALNPGTQTIWDVGGADTLDASAASSGASIDLRIGGYSNIGRTMITSDWYRGWTADAKASVIIGPDTIIEAARGTGYADTITGNDAANVLDGGGGDDTLAGGLGNDTYLVSSMGDLVQESNGQGIDTALSSVGYVLDPNTAVEILGTTNVDGSDPIFLTGNQFDQTITGNSGANILNGLGGSDTMIGLGGDDTYLVRGSGDYVVEANGGGQDLVYTTVSYNLGANEVEALSTVQHVDTTPINLIGNYTTQLVIGNYGNNVLNGGTGGLDTLIGLKGDDTYAVGDSGTVIIENVGDGSDTVVTSVSYTLAASVEIEALAVQDRASIDALNLTGNEHGQVVAGNDGANTLDGGGGSDVLIGYVGADTFAFTTLLGNGNVDTLFDFTAGTDKIGLSTGIFAAVGSTLDAAEFVVGAAALTTDQRIVYDAGTGQLFYDADGSGQGAAILFAQGALGSTLSVSDFVMIPPAAAAV